jgi:hypothetical protein
MNAGREAHSAARQGSNAQLHQAAAASSFFHYRTCIAIERAVWCRVRHEGEDGLADRVQRPCRAPGGLENVQADLPRLSSERAMGRIKGRGSVSLRATSVNSLCDSQGHNSSLLLTLKCTLGWKIRVRKRTLGGARGYCSGTLIINSKTPPSYGVSLGPCPMQHRGEGIAQFTLAFQGARMRGLTHLQDRLPHKDVGVVGDERDPGVAGFALGCLFELLQACECMGGAHACRGPAEHKHKAAEWHALMHHACS